jgi:hypothetical protein
MAFLSKLIPERKKLRRILMREMFELIENLSERYKFGNHETKYDILQKTEFELFIDNKKELVIKVNKLFFRDKITRFQLWQRYGESNSGLRDENPMS